MGNEINERSEVVEDRSQERKRRCAEADLTSHILNGYGQRFGMTMTRAWNKLSKPRSSEGKRTCSKTNLLQVMRQIRKARWSEYCKSTMGSHRIVYTELPKRIMNT